MENDSQKAGRHRNDTRKDTRLHCSDFSALKNPTTYSNTRSSPLLHLENRSDHHVLLVVVEVVHHLFCLLQELFQSVWQRMINSALNEMTLVWKVKNLKRPWGSHGAKNLQARGQGWQQASPSFDPFAYPSWFCHQTLLGGSPRKHLKYGFLPHPDIWHYLKESHYFRNYTCWKIALCHLLGPSTAWISGKTSSRSSLSRLWSMNNEHYNGSHLMYSTELYGLFLIGNGPKTNPWPLMAWKTITFGSPCASSVHQSSGAPWPLSS